MNPTTEFDITFLGHFTKDTIVYPTETKQVNGGAYYYGAHVAARMGKRVGIITRLAREDWRSFADLEQMGVTVMPRATPVSSCLRLIYPTANLDQRTLELTSFAGAFTLDQIDRVRSRAFAIVASSVRGEVPVEIVNALAARGSIIALDVQGFVRVLEDGKLGYDQWPGKESVLRHVTILKTDAVEAELITGESDHHVAAKRLAEFGPREILMTHSGGILLYHDGKFDQVPFVATAVRGRSGRGDTCTSAYLCRRLTAPPKDAVRWAAAVTSLKLETEGPFQRDLSEVQALYEQLNHGHTTVTVQ